MPAASKITILALTVSLGTGCAYISDDDEKWRLDPDDDGSTLGEDCDNEDPELAELVTWYVDADGDGFGAPGTEETGCSAPIGSADNGEDCDDNDSSVFPGAPDEWYDGVDSDCVGDDDYDQDGDGFPGGPDGSDCDDQDPALAPDDSIAEVYFNGVDDNCDWSDQDGDQDGDRYWAHDYVARVTEAGFEPMSAAAIEEMGGQPGDCWDDPDEPAPAAQQVLGDAPALEAAAVNPGATETWYDGADQDCQGLDSDGNGVEDDFDQDGDADADDVHPGRDGNVGGDCNDTDPLVSSAAVEQWYDGVDQDCDGWSDDDADKDGFDHVNAGGDDCYEGTGLDSEGAAGGNLALLPPERINPGATEAWYDGTDADCDEWDDYDADGDGHQYPGHPVYGPDCDDSEAAISPSARETWYDGVDQNCDGSSDFDADADGYDSSAYGGTDCNDGDPGINPGAFEICENGIDENCDLRDPFCG